MRHTKARSTPKPYLVKPQLAPERKRNTSLLVVAAFAEGAAPPSPPRCTRVLASMFLTSL